MENFLSDLASSNTRLLLPSLVSAIVAATVSYIFKRRETQHSAEVEYDYEQRKKLRELTGRYHGRLVSAANSLNYRLWNLYANHDKGWLAVGGGSGYYFSSTAYRLMSFFALIRLLESEAILLDSRIATKKDFVFLNYAAAFHWVMTDVALFDGTGYDNSLQKDHFFSDRFRHFSELCTKDKECISFDAFSSGPFKSGELDIVRAFLDGLCPGENRLRWDRIVSLHLLLMAFLNNYGYKRQKSSPRKFIEAAQQITNPTCLINLVSWLPRHDLRWDPGARAIKRAANTVI